MTPANPYLYASLSKNFLSLKLNSPFLSLSLYIYLFVCLLYTFSLFLSLFLVSLIYLQSFYTLILLTSFYISISIWWSLLFDPRIRLVSFWIQLGTLYFSVFFFCLFLGLHFCGYLFICVNLSWPRWVFMLILVWMLLDCLDIGFLGCDCWC